jgi:arginyl-tRNA synthetase
MHFEEQLLSFTHTAVEELFGTHADEKVIAFQPTRKEFEGDITLVVFPITKLSKKSPEETGKLIGDYLVQHVDFVPGYNVVKGFLNISIDQKLWLELFANAAMTPEYGISKADKATAPVMIEYASPNTNKPLHLGHMRNILLGYSVAEILKAAGNYVVKTSIVNDRGIHICKSMLAWQKFGNGETPASAGMKGDHLVGKYYVAFDKKYKEEIAALIAQGMNKEDAEKKSSLMQEARSLLLKWEEGDTETVSLWKMMNGWVYDGFDITYKRLGVDFDKIYYESNTYVLGKDIVQEGLQKKVLQQDADHSVWMDLTADGLDRKIMQRADGTSVYITQDLGTAKLRHDEFHFDSMIYVVGNEQDYHFKVLFKSLQKLGYPWAEKMYHLSYAMVDLPSGKMKSREGTVVDADDLMDEVIAAAKEETHKLGKVDEFTVEELTQLYTQLGMGALKYFILKVDPEKRMLFNPAESVEIHGNTGPYIQYVHARICSVLKRARQLPPLHSFEYIDVTAVQAVNEKEKALLKAILMFKDVVQEAAKRMSPAVIANYVYDLAKVFNQFYHENPIVDEAEVNTSLFRLQLAAQCASTIKKALHLLGIEAPARM